MECFIENVSFVLNFALRWYDFRGWWSATIKNRGRSKKTQWQTALKSRGGSLAVGIYLQRGSTPPPHPGRADTYTGPQITLT